MNPDPFLAQILLSLLAALALAGFGLLLVAGFAFLHARGWPARTWSARLLRRAFAGERQSKPRDRAELAGTGAPAEEAAPDAVPKDALTRPAALDALRLQAHQQAFVLWQRHIRPSDNRHLLESLQQCRAWWEEHCLYLEPSVRLAFAEACVHARLRSVLLQLGGSPALIGKARDKVEAFPDILCAALDTAPLSDVERSSFLHLNPALRAGSPSAVRVHPQGVERGDIDEGHTASATGAPVGHTAPTPACPATGERVERGVPARAATLHSHSVRHAS